MTDNPTLRHRRGLIRYGTVGVLVLFLAVAWVGFQAWQVQSRLTSAQANAVAVQREIAGGDQAKAVQSLAAFEREVHKASDITGGFTWRVMSGLPLLGNSFASIDTVAEVGERLGADGIRPLVETSATLSGDAFAPKDGRVPIAQLPALEAPVAQSSAAFTAAAEDLRDQDLGGVPDRVRSTYDGLQRKVDDAADGLAAANDALKLLPGMLGQDGARTYLLAVQNNAEVRSSGGMPGNQALLRVNDGKIRLTDQIAANKLGRFVPPILPQTAAEKAIFNTQPVTYPADTNFTPEFPRTAELLAAMWEKRKGDKVDGVVTLDVVTLSYLLKATGPVQGPDGPLTADNLVDQMLYGANIK